eukprot:TRINITY_DN7324_c0_g1_i2.p1 TRINITY_DN7324_c0_g1~~TRINITY_DN7324_c0_g1_i2.p1  ORF type:complete len:519 (-),score=142.40 TRINITY_DN7324_c0_g1_i2:170-1561(-)
MDGFRTRSEPTYLEIAEGNIAPFTMPVEAFSFVPEDDMVVSIFKSGDKERKIYCNIELFDEEKEALASLQEECKKQGLDFCPSIVIMAGRFLSRARGDPHKAIALMQATQEWRLDYFKAGPVSDTEVMEHLKHGVVYFCGRDFGMRPTLVCRALRIPNDWYKDKKAGLDKLIRTLIFCMEYMIRYMVVPGKIENNCLIVDLKGLGITGVPFSVLKEIYSVMSSHYIGRVFRFYVVNMSSTLSTIAGWAKALLTDRQKQKLCFLDDVNELKQDFALNQLEEDLGGTMPIAKTFFPFPMQGAPYKAGAAGSQGQKPIPGISRVLSDKGVRGKLWDPKLTKEENTCLEYTPEAYDFFTKNDIPVPAECKKQHEARLKAEKEAEEAKAKAAEQKSSGDSPGIANKEESATNTESSVRVPGAVLSNEAVEEEDEEEEEEEEEDNIIVDTAKLEPAGIWGCRPCWCSNN